MSDTIDITREDRGSGGRYVHRGADGTGPEAEMTFSKAGARILIIDHTEVPEAYKGQGVGLALVERAVADARADGKTIVPLCPFAAAMFRKHPEWADVLNGQVKPKT
ncbi:GNAT family N-acetyltransferase [Pseudooceanicola sp.]|uniref:GNAT family N-acetyltransferase n=1 Tax=Pseudooceanicola sp. TaxID=1914328 RepID=UPI0040585111